MFCFLRKKQNKIYSFAPSSPTIGKVDTKNHTSQLL